MNEIDNDPVIRINGLTYGDTFTASSAALVDLDIVSISDPNNLLKIKDHVPGTLYTVRDVSSATFKLFKNNKVVKITKTIDFTSGVDEEDRASLTGRKTCSERYSI